MFDSHCHLDDPRLAESLPAVLDRALKAGVTGAVVAGYGPKRWQTQRQLCSRHPWLVPAYGLHPWWIAESNPELLQEALTSLYRLLGRERPVAIGESGLDRSRRCSASLALQEQALRAQLGWARELRLPVILHVVRAHGRLLDLLEEEQISCGVVHSYSGSVEMAARYLKLGLHLGFSGACTHRPGHFQQVLRVTPEDRLLVETDSPDQAPATHAGRLNEPGFLASVVTGVAHLRGEDPEAVAEYSEHNARRLFGLEAVDDHGTDYSVR